ncbi:unnamed protein product [Adineta ricciae]|uniref:G-protein coupled receptors family 1 profile domain-containing protein n=1 Tax=Adineta ricciae TaxID=249248 RepID=A0A814NLK3_ADIRI|nr:unnamed protein product [Adineta ricciae]CAF1224654.1 unnamed protein product [Adineta ricciae]
MTSSSSTTATINAISRWLNYILAIPMIVVGILGATLTIFIFTRKSSFQRNPTIIYLLAGATMTAIHLPTVYLQSILVDGFGLGIFNTNNLACREHNYLLYVTTVVAISFPCWAAFDQYASTSRDANFRHRWSSIRVVRSAIIGTNLFWSIVYLPMLVYSGVENRTCILMNVTYRKFNDFLLTPLIYTIGPLTLITLFTRGILLNLNRTTVQSHRDHLTRQIRRMLIPQLILLAMSGIPFGLQNMYFNLTSNVVKSSLHRAIEHLCIQIIRLFYHFNFVFTFYIYLYMSSEVRKLFRRMTTKFSTMDSSIQEGMVMETCKVEDSTYI